MCFVSFLFHQQLISNISRSYSRQQALRYREIRLAAHVFLLSVMSATIFVYYWIEFSMAGNPDVSSELL